MPVPTDVRLCLTFIGPLNNREAQSMNQKQKAVSAYTHTHTHTHTSSFVCLLRTAEGRCLQWVSAFSRGILQWAVSAAGHIPATVRRAGRSHWASRRSGSFWRRTVLWLVIGAALSPEPSPSKAQTPRRALGQPAKLSRMDFPSPMTQPTISSQITAQQNITTSTASNLCRKAAA